MTTGSINDSRPADPRLISFDRECFETVGEKTVWVIVSPTGFAYPRSFDSLADAERARAGTQVIRESLVTVTRRVRWN